MFEPRQQVICIKHDDDERIAGHEVPQVGEIYTVDEIVDTEEGLALVLMEIPSPICACCGDEYAWDPDNFRPLTRRNIEIVEALKAPPPEQVEPLSPLEVAFQ